MFYQTGLSKRQQDKVWPQQHDFHFYFNDILTTFAGIVG